MGFSNWSCVEIVQGIREKKISCLEVAKSFLQEAEEKNQKLNAVVRMNPRVLELAKEIDDRKNCEEQPLRGLPLGIKDLFCTQGLETNACSKILKGFVPSYTATCVSRLEEAGAYTFAKLNMDEFAMGSSNETSQAGPCKNPWDLSRVPGGSSGGSAAAVAGAMVPAALGSDTGGSIRQPSHFCGLVGIKPTYGSVSRYGMVAFASSLDQAGPMTRDLKDGALLLHYMMGFDPKDPTTVRRKAKSLLGLQARSLKGVRVGLPKEYLTDTVSSDWHHSFQDVTQWLQSEGAELVSLSLPHTPQAVPVYYLIAASEASSNLSRYDGVRYGYRYKGSTAGLEGSETLEDMYNNTRSQGFGAEVKRRILLGTFSLSSGFQDAYYKKACQVRRLIQNDFFAAFRSVDFLLTPVSTDSAFPVGEKISDPMAMYYNDVFTTPASLAGLPGMSLPIGLDREKLPMGLQIIAPPYKEAEMIEFGMSIEKNFHLQEAFREHQL